MGDTGINYLSKTWNPCVGCGPDFQCWERCWARQLHEQRHKAYMQAARIAFGLSGIFDEDEARDIVKVQINGDGGDPLTLADKIKGNGKKPKPEVTKAAPPPEAPPEAAPEEVKDDGEVVTPPTLQEELAEVDRQEAEAAQQAPAEPEALPGPPPQATKEQLIPKIQTELKRLGKKEAVAAGIVGKPKFADCSVGNLQYILKKLQGE